MITIFKYVIFILAVLGLLPLFVIYILFGLVMTFTGVMIPSDVTEGSKILLDALEKPVSVYKQIYNRIFYE